MPVFDAGELAAQRKASGEFEASSWNYASTNIDIIAILLTKNIR